MQAARKSANSDLRLHFRLPIPKNFAYIFRRFCQNVRQNKPKLQKSAD
jgi:hypothetical protein